MRVRDDFEGGNIKEVIIFSKNHIGLKAREDGSPNPLWFCFMIDELNSPCELTIDLLNAFDCLGPASSWADVYPVYSENDGKTWDRISNTLYLETSGTFRFKHYFYSKKVILAYCYPYTSQNLESLLVKLSRSTGINRTVITKTPEQNTLEAIYMGESPEEAKLGIFIQAREHSGETPGSYVLEGFLEWFCSEEAVRARDLISLLAIPFVDVDGVKSGYYGKNRPPIDFARDWESKIRPEIHAITGVLNTWTSSLSKWVSISLHAPHHGDFNYFVIPPEDIAGKDISLEIVDLVNIISEELPSEIGFLAEKDIRIFPRTWLCGIQKGTPSGFYLSQHYGVPTFTLEASYHKCRSGVYTTIPLYKQLGYALARGTVKFLESKI